MWTKIRLRSVWAIVPVYLLLARPSVPLILAGLVVALAGCFVRAWAAGAIRKNRVLTTHGPYAFTRNPLYVGTFLIGLGFAIASGVAWFLLGFFLFFGVIYGKTMRREERRLAELFGEDFELYARAVPRFLPRLPAWSDVTGETSPVRRDARGARGGEPAAAGSAAVATVGDSRGSRQAGSPLAATGPFDVSRYLANREYQTLLGLSAMFLLLAAKLAL